MHNRFIVNSFCLSDEGIDSFSEWLNYIQIELKVERQNRTRVRLLMEDVLIKMREQLGADAVVSAFVDSRFGRTKLRIAFEGEPYNPLGDMENELSGWDSSLRTAIGLTPQYSYEGTNNVLRLTLPVSQMNPVVRIAISLALGTALGLLGMLFLPSETRELITDVLLEPIYNMWVRLLNAISGPIIFLTVVTTLLNTHEIEQRGGSSIRVIVRYFALSIIVVLGALLCGIMVFSLQHADLTWDRGLAYGLLDAFLLVVPSNIVEPFVTSNTSQLLFIAFSLSTVLIKLRSQVDGLKSLMRQANMIGLQVARWVSWLVPIFAGIFLCLELWMGQIGVLTDIWKPFSMSVMIATVILVVAILIACRLVHVRPFTLIQKLRSPFRIALKTGSLDDSFGEVQMSCTHWLGIDVGYAKVGLPQGLVLYMPISTVGTILFTLFTAQQFGVEANSIWYVSAIVMAVVVFVATPPVPGANLLAYVALFSALKIPSAALLDAMIFDIVFGIFAGAANQTMLQLEMLLQASRVGLLNRESLNKPLSKKR